MGRENVEVKALPAVDKAPPKMPSLLALEDEPQLLSQKIVEPTYTSEKLLEQVADPPEKPYVYRPPVKQSLDFKEALPEYSDFLQKYGKNLKVESTPRPDTNRSSLRSVTDSLRISPRVSGKKLEL